MDEFELIERFFARHGDGRGVVVGIGDDAAVLRPAPDRELVTVVDALVGDVHFPSQIDAYHLGYRAVAVNLSDIAAMGARPLWMTLALTLTEARPDWLEQFAAGLFAAADEHDVALVGGDTTRGDNVVVSVQVTGDIQPGRALLRSGARAGETIYVTGTVGDAAGGLECIRSGTTNEYLEQRFLLPAARVDCGQQLVGLASAAIDISDGLYGDLQKLLVASGVGADVDVDALPVSEALTNQFDDGKVRELVLGGGDDYELCFTSGGDLPARFGDVAVTAIGSVTDSGVLTLRDARGIVPFEDSGYRHFG
ncbi:MAG: thiamine-phosphate kinase [Woeseiaceae bacterium]|nr:thiamine-phosphate kinase [Woeseiaceae bacterium]